MQLKEFNELIKDKDLNKDEVKQQLVNQINDNINQLLISRDKTIKDLKSQITQKEEDLKVKDSELNLGKKSAEERITALENNIKLMNETNTNLKNANYIRTINNSLDDKAIEDVLVLANKDVKNENIDIKEAINKVMERLALNKVKKSQVNIPSPSSSTENIQDDSNQKSNYNDIFGI